MKKTLYLCAGVILWGAVVEPAVVRADAVYFVKDTDTLASLARIFKLPEDVLRTANRLAPDARLTTGTRLSIPEAAVAAAFPATTTAPAPVAVAEPAPTAPRGAVSQAGKDALAGLPQCAPETVLHEVARGDSLWSIAAANGLTVNRLRELNGLRGNRLLQIGERLVVGRGGVRSYTVRRGDNLWRIARGTGRSVEEILTLNALDNDDLRPGQVLRLDACREAPATATAATTEAPGEMHGPAPLAVTPEPAGFTERILAFAQTMLNIPYKWGGTTLKGLDCSAFVQKVFGPLDVALPRTVPEQFKVGEPVPRTELAAGDLVFFQTFARYPSHVGIYMGDNRFIHASSKGKRIMVERFDKPYYSQRYIGAKRLRRPLDPSFVGPDLY